MKRNSINLGIFNLSKFLFVLAVILSSAQPAKAIEQEIQAATFCDRGYGSISWRNGSDDTEGEILVSQWRWENRQWVQKAQAYAGKNKKGPDAAEAASAWYTVNPEGLFVAMAVGRVVGFPIITAQGDLIECD